MQLLDVGRGHAEKIGRLGQREPPQAFGGVRRIMLDAKHVQLVRDQFPLPENGLVKARLFDLADFSVNIHSNRFREYRFST